MEYTWIPAPELDEETGAVIDTPLVFLCILSLFLFLPPSRTDFLSPTLRRSTSIWLTIQDVN